MIKGFSIQTHGIYQSRPYTKFNRQDSISCKTPNKSANKKLTIQIKVKKQPIRNPEKSIKNTITPSKTKNKSKNKSVEISNNSSFNSPKLLMPKDRKGEYLHQSGKYQVIRSEDKQQRQYQQKKLQNIQSKIQLEQKIEQQILCCQITSAKTKTPIKRFLNLIRQSKKEEYLIKRLQSHAQKLDHMLGMNLKQQNVNRKYLQIQDIILKR